MMVESLFGTAFALAPSQAETPFHRRLKGNKDSDGVVTNIQPASKDKEKIVVIRLNC